MTATELLNKVDNIIASEVIDELRAQGHYNTGKLEESIEGKVKTSKGSHILEGTAAYYALILHHGFGPEKASWKQFPFLIEYFKSKGHAEKDAKGIAAATIRTWMREGMPSSGSYAYSSNGRRLEVIAYVKKAINGKVNFEVKKGLDKIINQKFHETKSETV